MYISIIAAVSENGVIGVNGNLPWHISEDLRYFKRTTMGKPVIMGRKTFETLKKPLSGRTNIVLTRQEDYQHEGCVVVHSMDDAIQVEQDAGEIMVAGGAAVYRAALPLANRMYITRIHHQYEGTVFFPEADFSRWEEISRDDRADIEQNLHYSFIVYEKTNSQKTS